ncbi:hypothetical protein V2O64_24505 (plasmid) [Verrucomicrobiaceae bacterium 227]
MKSTSIPLFITASFAIAFGVFAADTQVKPKGIQQNPHFLNPYSHSMRTTTDDQATDTPFHVPPDSAIVGCAW